MDCCAPNAQKVFYARVFFDPLKKYRLEPQTDGVTILFTCSHFRLWLEFPVDDVVKQD